MIPRELKGSNLKYLMMLQIEIENTNIFNLLRLIKCLAYGNKKTNPKIHEEYSVK